MHNIFGLPIHVSPDHNKYTLPEEVIRGVPWPKGFREEINKWSRDFIGIHNLVADGQVLKVGDLNAYILANPRTYEQMKIQINSIKFSP